MLINTGDIHRTFIWWNNRNRKIFFWENYFLYVKSTSDLGECHQVPLWQYHPEFQLKYAQNWNVSIKTRDIRRTFFGRNNINQRIFL